jgi:hypothetical protein
MALLFADEDFPIPAVLALRALSHDVLTTQEAGLAGIGIVVCTRDPDSDALAARIHVAIKDSVR